MKQFPKTVARIWKHEATFFPLGLSKHLFWQVRKLLRLFPAKIKISESHMLTRSGSCSVSALVNCMGMYDFKNMNLIKRVLKDGGTFIDVGANVGSYTLLASEGAAKVFSFEAHPKTFEVLKENCISNGRTGLVLENVGVSDKQGVLRFTDVPLSSVNKVVESEISDGIIEVKTISLDEYFFDHESLARPIVMKIDVEGHEESVLNGAKSLLSETDIVILEISKRRDRCINLMAIAGLKGPFHLIGKISKLEFSVKREIEDELFFREPNRYF